MSGKYGLTVEIEMNEHEMRKREREKKGDREKLRMSALDGHTELIPMSGRKKKNCMSEWKKYARSFVHTYGRHILKNKIFLSNDMNVIYIADGVFIHSLICSFPLLFLH